MGMLLINQSFAKRIIEKYSAFGTYDLEQDSLVFYKGGFAAGLEEPSAYYTKLVLNLLLTLRNYGQSGQHLSMNWNMVNQIVMKTVSGLSLQMEKSLEPILKGSGRQQSQLTLDQLHEAIWELLYDNSSTDRRRQPAAVFNSIRSGRLKRKLAQIREKEMRQEHISEWLISLSERDSAEVLKNILQVVRHSQTLEQKITEYLKEEMQEEKQILLRLAKEEPEQVFLMMKQIFAAAGESHAGEAVVHIFRKYEDRVFLAVESKMERKIMHRQGIRYLAGQMESILESASIRPELAVKARRELSEILNFDFNTTEMMELSEEAVMKLKENPQILGKLGEMIGHLGTGDKERLEQWVRRYEVTPESAIYRTRKTVMEQVITEEISQSEQLQRLQEELLRTAGDETGETTLFGRIITILGSRFTEPGKAKEAEQELFHILRQDFPMEERDFVWRRRENLPDIQWQIQMLQELLQHQEVVTMIRNQVQKSEQENQERLKIWIHKYRQTMIEEVTAKQRRELVLLVRKNMGNEAADKLEAYFSGRERITSKVLEERLMHNTDETIQRIMNSYLSIMRKEDAIAGLEPVGYTHLHLMNRLRESVHEPPAQSAKTIRRNLDMVISLTRRSYLYNQTQNRMIAEAREWVGELAWRGLPTKHTAISEVQHSWGEVKTEFLRNQILQENELDETRKTVKRLNEKVEIQDKVMAELKKKATEPAVQQLNLNHLTKQIMKKMEDELRIEKMRRGLL